MTAQEQQRHSDVQEVLAVWMVQIVSHHRTMLEHKEHEAAGTPQRLIEAREDETVLGAEGLHRWAGETLSYGVAVRSQWKEVDRVHEAEEARIVLTGNGPSVWAQVPINGYGGNSMLVHGDWYGATEREAGNAAEEAALRWLAEAALEAEHARKCASTPTTQERR